MWGFSAILIVALSFLVAILVAEMRDRAERAQVTPPTTRDEGELDDPWEDWIEPPRGAPAPSGDDPAIDPEGPERARWGGGEPGAPTDPERAERFRQRLQRSVTITPLGDEPTTLTPEQVWESLADGRRAMRDCMRENGGFEALREARRAQEDPSGGAAPTGTTGAPRGEGRRPRPRATFDVAPDGSLVAESLRIDSPLPAPFDRCMALLFQGARFENPPTAGARVEMRMPGGGGRRRGQSNADGGVRRERQPPGGDTKRAGPPRPPAPSTP